MELTIPSTARCASSAPRQHLGSANEHSPRATATDDDQLDCHVDLLTSFSSFWMAFTSMPFGAASSSSLADLRAAHQFPSSVPAKASKGRLTERDRTGKDDDTDQDGHTGIGIEAARPGCEPHE